MSGTDRYYFDLLRFLTEKGDHLNGVVLGDPQAVEYPVNGVESFAPEGSGAFRRWSGLRSVVRRLVRESDIVVSHFAAHAFPVLDTIGRRPLVVHFHNPWLSEGRASGAPAIKLFVRWMQENLVYKRAERFIVLSEANAAVLSKGYGVSNSRIRIIPGGTDLARFSAAGSREEARERLGWPLHRPIITIVGRLVAAKGIDRAIEALVEIRRRVPDVLLAVIGAGPEAAALHRLASELDLETNIHFAGFQSAAVPDAYRAADIALVPSIAFESFGLVAAEALACGTPVFVTPLLGLPEVVRSLEPKLVLDGMEPGHIADRLVNALTGRLALPDAAACTAYARRFDWREVSGRIHEVYAELT